jgi:acyl-CoA dehydrogenase
MQLKTQLTLPSVGLTGFETPLAEEEAAIQASVHRFAREVLRPLGAELDKMSADEVVAPGSPYYTVFAEYAKLGLSPELLGELPPEMAVRLESLIGEELGWGDAGLGVSLGAAGFPLQMAVASGNRELVELCADKIGCWVITQPDKGSDVQVFDMAREWVPGQPGNKGNLWGQLRGDDIVINGQCSAWVSNGAVAQVALCYIGADYGDGFFAADGRPHGMAVIVPLDLPGVTRGRARSTSTTYGYPSAMRWHCATSTTATWPRPGPSPGPTCPRCSPAWRAPLSRCRCSTAMNASRAAAY